MKHIISFLLAALLITACSPTPAPVAEASTPKTPQALQPTAVPQPYSISSNQTEPAWDHHMDLKSLPLTQVSVEGKVEEGPKLLDILALMRVTNFTEVTLTGSSNPATLTSDQVDENTILDFTNHGTVRLATTYIPKPIWTKDISKIEVKE
jgi:hypothetical protein